ncbi:MAG: helix-turn-helix domain-containing protein [Clostridia bacterium]|nr:helix-turn-helix domain-containing protein [Clostridia bacterium]
MKLSKFPENLRISLSNNKISQQKLADYLGTTQATVSRWVNGECEPELSMLIEICLYLDETPNELLGFDDLPSEVISKYQETL